MVSSPMRCCAAALRLSVDVKALMYARSSPSCRKVLFMASMACASTSAERGAPPWRMPFWSNSSPRSRTCSPRLLRSASKRASSSPAYRSSVRQRGISVGCDMAGSLEQFFE
ncbi:hypothetical protein DR_2054 [Deinococcus radiodurans R1 = ATCC 13939 = DSM 20539]|uniref:Uncharacterized protein n=1 Tax=Deinococcus radiodurans (strain ATCC 13939 / DSM 20539 / JCM 16871 / CCUG 27074 / LMG 4051 / NBRC 15346 / NCIMB 9279 / VKM B-1422 / R1) TaxID=243230 RepID=Q9RSS0_DEIRA|nr:hypothetical protein DR_2054 [Deinococcus radiodurans R1 = ATCC 13939 = DSM 20539]